MLPHPQLSLVGKVHSFHHVLFAHFMQNVKLGSEGGFIKYHRDMQAYNIAMVEKAMGHIRHTNWALWGFKKTVFL